MKEKFMKIALEEAKKAFKSGEVPVGAVIVKDKKIIACSHNEQHKEKSAIKHAEIIAIEKASKVIGDFRLNDCDIYITLEPCAMCAGAIINSRIKNIFFGAFDEKMGCLGSICDLSKMSFSHNTKVHSQIFEEESAKLLKEFFKNIRKKGKSNVKR